MKQLNDFPRENHTYYSRDLPAGKFHNVPQKIEKLIAFELTNHKSEKFTNFLPDDNFGYHTKYNSKPPLDQIQNCRWNLVADLLTLTQSNPLVTTPKELQKWEGYVVSIEDEAIVANLIDLTAGDKHESVEATIPLPEFSDCDMEDIKIGSIFQWIIWSKENYSKQTVELVSQIKFLDYPMVTESDFAEGKAWAREIVAAIGP